MEWGGSPPVAGAVILASGLAVLIPATAQAAVACDEASLVTAINLANSSGGGNIPLTPGCTYTLTSSNGSGTNGPDGLPIITTAISLTGTADVITRSAAAPAFRIAEVSAAGSLTLTSVTLSNGNSLTGDGGGILNFGNVTVNSGGLTDNTAAGNGGGIASINAVLTLTSSPVSANAADADGGRASVINPFTDSSQVRICHPT